MKTVPKYCRENSRCYFNTECVGINFLTRITNSITSNRNSNYDGVQYLHLANRLLTTNDQSKVDIYRVTSVFHHLNTERLQIFITVILIGIYVINMKGSCEYFE